MNDDLIKNVDKDLYINHLKGKSVEEALYFLRLYENYKFIKKLDYYKKVVEDAEYNQEKNLKIDIKNLKDLENGVYTANSKTLSETSKIQLAVSEIFAKLRYLDPLLVELIIGNKEKIFNIGNYNDSFIKYIKKTIDMEYIDTIRGADKESTDIIAEIYEGILNTNFDNPMEVFHLKKIITKIQIKLGIKPKFFLAAYETFCDEYLKIYAEEQNKKYLEKNKDR